ncbi:MAG: SRPBCC family protein [Bacteroidota bacterium]
MPIIQLEMKINAEIGIVFDLSRSIDLHKISTRHTHEEAVAGVTSGLIKMGESVTWRAKHFGIYQKLTSKITAFDRPNYFVDEMVKGAFKRFKHEHIFEEQEGQTLMKDVFEYESPLGLLGNMADALILEKYMRRLLEKRNETIKVFAETERWKEVLG